MALAGTRFGYYLCTFSLEDGDDDGDCDDDANDRDGDQQIIRDNKDSFDKQVRVVLIQGAPQTDQTSTKNAILLRNTLRAMDWERWKISCF